MVAAGPPAMVAPGLLPMGALVAAGPERSGWAVVASQGRHRTDGQHAVPAPSAARSASCVVLDGLRDAELAAQ